MIERAHAVIMAGGQGERFWPLSTSRTPKQFLRLIGDKPMLGLAVGYLKGLVDPSRILVITRADLVQATRAAAPELPAENIIGEPFGRDTAAACALGTALVAARDPDGVILVMTADHIIDDIDVFQTTVSEGFGLVAGESILMTIGMAPSFASTGFGYIETAEAVPSDGETTFLKAVRFVEKPDRDTAEKYLSAGNYFWNSGMFLWSVTAFLRALQTHHPRLLQMAKRMTPLAGTADFEDRLKTEYDRLERISVDYAVMENADNIVMARGAFGWDDVGSWPALANHFAGDADNNVVIGTCEALASRSNLVVSQGRLTALIGVEDLVVVQAGNATLVCRKDLAQDVKRLVHRLRSRGSYEDLL